MQEKPIRNYKDTIFRMIFKEAKELLALYNAVNDTHYENPDDLEITTLENAIYMNMKNDVSCVLDMQMNLYEHQSTVNPNTPLRNLMYTARLFEKEIAGKDVYSRRQIMLPTPKFITFYNGIEPQPERKVMRLSDSFAKKDGEVNLELIVLQLNINPGFNEDLKRNCPALCQYMQYVEKVRHYREEMSIEEAVERAVDECIAGNILKEFFQKQKSEAVQMSIFEYDEELHKRTLREEGFEDGFEDGTEYGKSLGKAEGIAEVVLELLEDLGEIPEEISRKILEESDLELLRKWHKLAARADSIDDFQKNMESEKEYCFKV